MADVNALVYQIEGTTASILSAGTPEISDLNAVTVHIGRQVYPAFVLITARPPAFAITAALRHT